MAMEIVISLPLILLSVIIGFGCYFYGRAKGRQQAAQIFGSPAPPYAARTPSPEVIFKPNSSDNV
ncbi:hypothetical protein M569_08811 [Genlisea aurea]|uniref:Uncharacterized protein n=1 Tax=Genlisea aurea TaxID=192259 RepID=S8E125_9LAMI|nr:hypothetical protein M569_08811 [Genlisea aurea]